MDNIEAHLASRVQELRRRDDLNYRQLAERMKANGFAINQGSIQKAEKSGRRVPIDEVVAYAQAFNMSVNELLGIHDDYQADKTWPTYINLERLANVRQTILNEYGESLSEVRGVASDSPELVSAVRDRRAKYLATFEAKARRQAESDGDDVSTPEKLEKFMERWGYFDAPVLTAARDVLEGVDNGEGK